MSLSTFGRHHSPASGAGTGPLPVAVADVLVHEGGPLLDAEKLDCYRLAIEFQPVAAAVAAKAGYNLRDQFERAALSVALNTAEGAGRRSKRERRHFYQIARGSAAECGALLDVLLARGLASAVEVRDAKHSVIRLVQMLTRLDAKLQ